jgi:GNAT superfamily N-acetyltransferase
VIAALPDPLHSFWYEMSELNAACRRTRWGAVVSDPRFPLVWDANHAAVLEDAPGLTLEEIRSQLHPALRRAGAPFEHVEFWESPASPALRELREGSDRGRPDVDLVFEGPAPPGPDRTLDLREIDHPDDRFLDWYRGSRLEFGDALSDEVLEQLLARDLIVLVPAGLRWFVAYVDEEPAGFTSLLSLGGVGYIDGVVTTRPFRRRGIATATVARALQASLFEGDALVHLLAEEHGSARALYERLGFRVWGSVESFTRRMPEKG